MNRSILLAFALAVALFGRAWAHGDLHEQIADVAAQIAKSPGDGGLYLKRAELHRVHEDWDAALADYEMAERLSAPRPVVALGRGKLLLARGSYGEALAPLNEALAANPEWVDALVARARVLELLGRFPEAVSDFDAAIERSPSPEPDWYLERARVQTQAAPGAIGIDAAVSGLDAGLARLGPLPTLQLYAIELEQERGRVDAALARLESLRKRANRQESWLERIGDVQLRAGRVGDARFSYTAASKALADLPGRLRNTPSMQAMRARLQDKIASSTEASDSVH